ncbi:MAG: hypothetical protein J6S89_08160 [Paludibacteraceae bacterium]|nr:hypothetical protein [Paludibacteraceae bacterium]MBP5664536.1 hypothetical protein [Bacteroidales bacterium]
MREKIKIIVRASFDNMGTVSVTDVAEQTKIDPVEGDIYEVEKGVDLYLIANAKESHRFVVWNDGTIENNRKIQVTEENEYMAVFTPITKSNCLCLLLNKLLHANPISVQTSFAGNESFNNANSNISNQGNAKEIENKTKNLIFKGFNPFWMFLILLLTIISISWFLLSPLKHYIEELNHLDAVDFIQKAGPILLYCVIIGVIVMVSIIMAVRSLLPYFGKKLDFEQKMWELQYRNQIRFQDEDRKYERLGHEMEMALHDKKEKAIIEENVRDNEHKRKLDIKERERIAELSKVILELAKIKNTITIKDSDCNNKTIVIEKSVLTNDK